MTATTDWDGYMSGTEYPLYYYILLLVLELKKLKTNIIKRRDNSVSKNLIENRETLFAMQNYFEISRKAPPPTIINYKLCV